MTDHRYPHIVRAVYGQPWMIERRTFDMIDELLQARLAGAALSDEEIRERLISAASSNGPRSGGRRAQGVAVIPVYGVLANHAGDMRSSGATTVDEIRADFRDALANEDVGSIVFDVDSPGGSVDGIEEFAAEIRAARGQKPIVAVANVQMDSAAYYLGSQADEIVVTPSGRVGSIGVLMAHREVSKQAEIRGERTTLISAGRYKTEGNQYEPLSDEARAFAQTQVDEYYGMFVDAVAKGRGVTPAAVRSGYGEGRELLAKPAKAAGLVDRIDTLENTIRRAGTGKIAMRADGVKAQAWPTVMVVDETHTTADAELAGALDFLAGPIPVHHGTTDDGEFDGPGTEAAIPNTEGAATFRRMYAYVDENADPDTKAAYDFVHHFWRGAPGPASTRACSSGIGVCNEGRGGGPGSRWWGDREGIHAHLGAHLRDAGLDVPSLMPMGAHTEIPAGSGTGLPFAARLEAVAAEMEEIVALAERRKGARASEGRDLSVAARAQLGLLGHRIETLLASAPASPGEADQRAHTRARLAVLEAAALAGYHLD
jgi:signal peptide peptidase SppA